MDGTVKLIYFLLVVSVSRASVPGTFFWRPRIGLDLSVPTTVASAVQIKDKVPRPTVKEIKDGHAVLIDGYQVGVTVLALTLGYEAWEKFPHLNPFKAWFYTTAYRWGLRHLSLIPQWLRGGEMSYIDTHRVWRRRFWYSDRFVPKWLQLFLPHVWEFDREKHQYRRWTRYVRPAFAKHLHYPGEVFNNWQSEESTETVENLDMSDFSIHIHNPDY
ncbi:uncharacterized protein [Battus philenor]|uniref:uncharacterized protein n=1 Tax=Battus philenor TaxID=42288 RepID=UPI0035CF7445